MRKAFSMKLKIRKRKSEKQLIEEHFTSSFYSVRYGEITAFIVFSSWHPVLSEKERELLEIKTDCQNLNLKRG